MARNLATLLLVLSSFVFSLAEDDKKWVWGDNNRSGGRTRDFRYEVFEDEEPIRPSYGNNDFYDRPHHRPSGGIHHRPPYQRPGGVYDTDNLYNGNYAGGHLSHHPVNTDPGILTGPVPSWVKEGPYKNFDKCKCTEKFNCPSPGISYGHCDVGKQYCCFSTKKRDQLGGPLPSRPVHSAENGILVGPNGPVDVPRPGGYPQRPLGNYPVRRPGGGFGVSGGPIGGGNRPVYSPDNGILVGPGGPYDRPVGNRPGGYGSYGGFGRSAKN